MSSLVISVLILAAAAIVAVVVVNVAQAVTRRRRLAASLERTGSGTGRSGASGSAQDGHADSSSPVRSSAERREPTLGDVPARSEPEPSLNGAAGVLGAAAESPPDVARLSTVYDCVVALTLEPPVNGDRLIAVTQGLRRAGSKPVLVEGVRHTGSMDPEPLVAGLAYKGLRIGVLLANRAGPLNAMEYSEFVASVQAVADQLSALADTPDMGETVARAREIDSACAQLDAQIGLNVELPEAVGPAHLVALAAALDLGDRGGHRYARVAPDGSTVFTVSLTDSAQRIGFMLDVPRTPENLGGWPAMLDCARQAAARLGGTLVDDSGRPVQAESLGTIERQLTQRYRTLDSIGLAAGSALALRVFK
jgi:hypothetical protein